MRTRRWSRPFRAPHIDGSHGPYRLLTNAPISSKMGHLIRPSFVKGPCIDAASRRRPGHDAQPRAGVGDRAAADPAAGVLGGVHRDRRQRAGPGGDVPADGRRLRPARADPDQPAGQEARAAPGLDPGRPAADLQHEHHRRVHQRHRHDAVPGPAAGRLEALRHQGKQVGELVRPGQVLGRAEHGGRPRLLQRQDVVLHPGARGGLGGDHPGLDGLHPRAAVLPVLHRHPGPAAVGGKREADLPHRADPPGNHSRRRQLPPVAQPIVLAGASAFPWCWKAWRRSTSR